MLGLDDYGSGSESESESQKVTQPQLIPGSSMPKSKLNLLPISATGPSDSLPTPKSTKRAPKKIAIGLPALSKDGDEEKDSLELEKPAPKRQKMSGAGVSGLLSMLPAPKQKNVVPQQQRVLGGGKGSGLVFDLKSSAPASKKQEVEDEGEGEELTASTTSTLSSRDSLLPFLPPSLVKGKANISLEDKPKVHTKSTYPIISSAPVADFFSIGMSKVLLIRTCSL